MHSEICSGDAGKETPVAARNPQACQKEVKCDAKLCDFQQDIASGAVGCCYGGLMWAVEEISQPEQENYVANEKLTASTARTVPGFAFCFLLFAHRSYTPRPILLDPSGFGGSSPIFSQPCNRCAIIGIVVNQILSGPRDCLEQLFHKEETTCPLWGTEILQASQTPAENKGKWLLPGQAPPWWL